jgi:hypothetical protein
MIKRYGWLRIATAVAALGLGTTFLAGNAQAGRLRDRGWCYCCNYGWATTVIAIAPSSRGITAPVPPKGGSQDFLPPAPPGSVAVPAAETAPAKAPPPTH